MSSTTIDRRSALKKAAAAGAVVWTAPLVNSSPALAQTVSCTPKCSTPTFTVDIDVFNYCPNQGSKWARVRLTPSNVTCPCTGTTAIICVDGPNTDWSKDGATDGRTVEPAEAVANGWPVIPSDSFVVKKLNGGGSLGDGIWNTTGLTRVAQGCADRTGDIVWRICSFSVGFEFHPGTGNCAQEAGVGDDAASPVGDCTLVCQPAPGSCPLTP